MIGDEDDLARADGDTERRGRERAEHVDDDRVARRRARTVEEARDADVHGVRCTRPVARS